MSKQKIPNPRVVPENPKPKVINGTLTIDFMSFGLQPVPVVKPKAKPK